MRLRPFRGLRPTDELASRIASYPYDVVNSEEAREIAGDDPYSFLHVVRPEIDLDPGVDPYSPEVYAQGRKNLDALIDKGWMVRDEPPAYYVYRLTMDGASQTGVLGASAVDDYRQGLIKRHEFTRPVKEDDRVRLNTALAACPGPVFVTYRGTPELDATISGITAADPSVDFTAKDGIRHELWVVAEPAPRDALQAGFAALPESYVADGHHRAAAAARVAEALLAQVASPTGNEAAGHFLTAYFPADQLRVLDYNRVVRDLNGRDAPALLAAIREAGLRLEAPEADRRPARRGEFAIYVAGGWHRLLPDTSAIPTGDAVRSLDVAVLSEQVLEPLLGIGDPRTDKRIDFVGGIRGMDELERLVDSGEYAVAFAVYPTSIDDVMNVADAGEVMPPKSTWFEPKLRSGLVVQSLVGDRL